jgi:hypothetical protein
MMISRSKWRPLKSSSTLNMPVSFTESYARAKYARLLIFAPQPPRQGPRRFRLRHGRLRHRPPTQAPGPEGRSASGDMKSERTMTQPQAKTSKMSRIHPQKIAPASLIAQTH